MQRKLPTLQNFSPTTGALHFFLYALLVIIGALTASSFLWVRDYIRQMDRRTEAVAEKLETQIRNIPAITQGYPIGKQSAQYIPEVKIIMPIEHKGCWQVIGCRFEHEDIRLELPAAGEQLLENCELIIDEIVLAYAEGPFKGSRAWSFSVEILPTVFHTPPIIPEGVYQFRWNPHTNCRGLNSRLKIEGLPKVTIQYEDRL